MASVWADIRTAPSSLHRFTQETNIISTTKDKAVRAGHVVKDVVSDKGLAACAVIGDTSGFLTWCLLKPVRAMVEKARNAKEEYLDSLKD